MRLPIPVVAVALLAVPAAFAQDEADAAKQSVARLLLIEAQARHLMAGEAAERAESDAVVKYAEEVRKDAEEAEKKLKTQLAGVFDVRPSREASDAKPGDTNGLTAKEAGLLAGGAKPVEPSPGRWNPIGERAVNKGVLTPGGDPDASTGEDAKPAGLNEDEVGDPAVEAARQVREASTALAKTMNALDKAESFDAAYLKADRRRVRETLDALKEAAYGPAAAALAKEARSRLRADLKRARELQAEAGGGGS